MTRCVTAVNWGALLSLVVLCIGPAYGFVARFGVHNRRSGLGAVSTSDSVDEGLGVFGRRVDATKLTREMYRELFEGQYPVVLFNVFAPSASASAAFHEQWSSEMLSVLAQEEIEYDLRQNSNSTIEGFATTLDEFLGALGEQSDHEESMYLMNEDLLNEVPEAQDLVQRLALPKELFGQDLFEYFPLLIRPLTALIIGGAGARSFLHADPYEWTGWNYLFEGKKIWNFLPPSVSTETLGARRNSPDAWGDFNISAGWVSDDVDLFKRIGLGPGETKTALNMYLVRHYEGLVAASQRAGGGIVKKKKLSTALEAVSKPLCFFSGNEAIDGGLDTSRCLQIIQNEGEMVLIPPRWWHQVYHVEPSIAVAGQYCNDHGKNKVFRHILEWCGSGSDKGEEEISEVLLRELPRLQSDRDQVLRVIELGLEWAKGPRAGKDVFARLVKESKEASELP